MPETNHCIEQLGLSSSQFVSIRRKMLSDLLRRFNRVSLPDTPVSLDDGILALCVGTIGPTEEAVHSHMPYWVAFLKYIVKRLNLHQEVDGAAEEEMEERRRFET